MVTKLWKFTRIIRSFLALPRPLLWVFLSNFIPESQLTFPTNVLIFVEGGHENKEPHTEEFSWNFIPGTQRTFPTNVLIFVEGNHENKEPHTEGLSWNFIPGTQRTFATSALILDEIHQEITVLYTKNKTLFAHISGSVAGIFIKFHTTGTTRISCMFSIFVEIGQETGEIYIMSQSLFKPYLIF